MDQSTIEYYNENAEEISKEYLSYSPLFPRKYALKYFHKGFPTLDVGCGNGRDVHWLSEQGYPCSGVDASYSMIVQAKMEFPKYNYSIDNLPNLETFNDDSFFNIFCCAVLSHLPKNEIILAIFTFSEILKDKGILVLSYRCSPEHSEREGERLFSLINENNLKNICEFYDLKCLESETNLDMERNILWYNYVFEKNE